MSEYKTEIIKIKDLLLKDNLAIPEYQRPYKWTTKNVNQLIDDILFFNDKEAYRLGTVVLHKEDDKEVLNIVDGQQRTISLYLIYLALGDASKKVVEVENKITVYSIENGIVKDIKYLNSIFELEEILK